MDGRTFNGRNRGRKKTACYAGHPLTAGNIYTYSNGGRACRTCVLLRARLRTRDRRTA
jgi:hypothetical protein